MTLPSRHLTIRAAASIGMVCLIIAGAIVPQLSAQQSGVKSYEELKKAWGSRTRSFGTSPSKVRKTTRGIQVVEVKVDPESAVTFENILFKIDSTEMADESSKEQVKVIAKVMKDLSDYRFLIEGHTCDLGSDDHNKGLSERRADAIRSYLVREGVDSSRLEVLGFGEADPAVENSSDAQRVKNRRVVVYRKST